MEKHVPARLRFTKSFLSTHGFTLLEVIIAAGVFTMLVFGVYKIYSSVSRTRYMGQWTNAALMQMRNGLSLLRAEIGRASPPEIITQKGSEPIPGTDDMRKLYVPSSIPYETDCKTDEKILQFYMCKPGRKDIPGLPDISAEVIKGVLEVKNKQIIYSRNCISQPSDVTNPTPLISQVICENPCKLQVDVKPVVGSLSVKLKNFVKITITAQHPLYVNTQVTETVEAPFEVEFSKGNGP